MDIKLTEAERIKILNSDDIFEIMHRILLRENKIDQNREHFWVIGLENNNRILFIELICLGTVNKTFAEPMEVFSLALQKRAVNIILCHNHPSGELKPSAKDKDITDRLIQVGKIVSTEVVDHLIITEKSYLSFTDIGLIEELKKSTRWVPEYEIQEQIKKQATEIAKERAYNEKMKIVKNMKEKGIEYKEIAEMTGVTIEEIEKLKVRKK